MNFAIVRYLIGWMLGIESIFLLLPALGSKISASSWMLTSSTIA